MNKTYGIGLIVLLSGCIWFFLPVTSRVVLFDKQAVVAHFVAQLSQHTLTKSMLRQKTAQFSQALTTSLQQYAVMHHVLIIDKSLVLAGGEDKTDRIMRLLAKEMRGG